jgi:hypothetical protein
MNNFWSGFEKRAEEAAMDRSGRETAAMNEEQKKYEASGEVKNEEERRNKREWKLSGNMAGAPAGGTL